MIFIFVRKALGRIKGNKPSDQTEETDEAEDETD